MAGILDSECFPRHCGELAGRIVLQNESLGSFPGEQLDRNPAGATV